MTYVPRFVQRFRAADEAPFRVLEAWTEVHEVRDFPEARRRRAS